MDWTRRWVLAKPSPFLEQIGSFVGLWLLWLLWQLWKQNWPLVPIMIILSIIFMLRWFSVKHDTSKWVSCPCDTCMSISWYVLDTLDPYRTLRFVCQRLVWLSRSFEDHLSKAKHALNKRSFNIANMWEALKVCTVKVLIDLWNVFV